MRRMKGSEQMMMREPMPIPTKARPERPREK
jgi:hypothetical protein